MEDSDWAAIPEDKGEKACVYPSFSDTAVTFVVAASEDKGKKGEVSEYPSFSDTPVKFVVIFIRIFTSPVSR